MVGKQHADKALLSSGAGFQGNGPSGIVWVFFSPNYRR
jgi:hypothetical protein